MVDCLIEHGAQINIASHLIELAAQIDQLDSKGWFPLMYAVKGGDLEMVQILIAYGANVSLRNRDGQTILDVCPQELVNLPLFQELVSQNTYLCGAPVKFMFTLGVGSETVVIECLSCHLTSI